MKFQKILLSFFSYIREIFSGERKMPRLADSIAQKALSNSTLY